MTNWLSTLLLGVVQGIAEFLPVSSSGHLVIIQALLKRYAGYDLPDPVQLNIVLHAGTLLSILVVYRARILRLLGPDREVIPKLIVGTLPAVAIGLPLHEMDSLQWLLTDPLLAGAMLPLTGLLLIVGNRLGTGQTDYTAMSYRQALSIGLFQAVAILPGISRSGATIVGGLLVGLRRDAAATFSFFLAIIAICGAIVLELRKFATEGVGDQGLTLMVGAAVSFVVGMFALRLLLRWLNEGRLHWFAAWCIPVGLLVVAWQVAIRFGS